MEKERGGTFRMRVKQSRAFFFSLVAVMVIWVATSMSDVKNYREEYAVEIVGIDTARYAVIRCDSVLTFDIASNGFRALGRSINHHPPIRIDVSGLISASDTVIRIDIEKNIDIVKRQMDLRGVTSVTSLEKYLYANLAQRDSKTLAIDISNVKFSFDGMDGLCGAPVIKPDSVTIYGSSKSLAKIDRIAAKSQTIPVGSRVNRYTIQLDDSWRKYSDLRCPRSSVTMYIPVTEYVEKSIDVPINIVSDDNIQRINLYPPTVNLKVLVPKDTYADVSPQSFTAEVRYAQTESDELEVTISRFPSQIRIKSVNPSKVKYIVIK